MIRKILLVTPKYIPHPGGCAKSVQLLFNALQNRSELVADLLVLEASKATKTESIQSYNLDARTFIGVVKAISILWKNIGLYDVVHVYNVYLIPHVVLARMLLFNRKKPKIVATLNNYNWGCLNPIYFQTHQCQFCTRGRIRKCSNFFKGVVFKIGARLTSKIDKAIAFSEAGTKPYLLQGFPRERIVIMQNLKPSWKALPLKSQFPSKEETFVFLCIGSLDARKGIDVLLKATSRLKGLTNRSFEILVLGEGRTPFLSEDLKPLVKFQIVEPDSPEFFSILRSSNALIHPSRWNEPFARAWMEAAAFGLPILSSNVGTSSEILNGAALFHQFDSDSELSKNMASVMEEQTFEKYAEKSKSFFQNLLDASETLNEIVAKVYG